MAEPLATKQVLADALKELLTTHTFSKIKVNDIVEHCGINRQTFYYHFDDKYDLVNWIFFTEIFSNLQQEYSSIEWDTILKLCEYFYQNLAFYRRVLLEDGPNSFTAYFGTLLRPLFRAQVMFSSIEIPDASFYAIFFSDAILASVRRWILEGAKNLPQDFVLQMERACRDFALVVLEKDRDEALGGK